MLCNLQIVPPPTQPQILLTGFLKNLMIPEILDEHEFSVVLLYEELEMLQRHDHLLHEGGDPLRSLIVDDLLELLTGNIREAVMRIHDILV
jgi:hypothetical protein